MNYDIKPAFQEKNIPIVFASSAYYVPYLSVTIKSVIETAKADYNYDILILHKEITDTEIRKMQTMVKENNFSIRFIKVDKFLDGQDYNFRDGYSPESFYRVVMVDILKMYDKVIYLDCDVIVKKSVSELYCENDVRNYYVAATKDIDGMASSICDHENRKQYMLGFLGLNRLEDYFQSGVMIFNLKKIREDFSLADIIKASCAEEIMFGDQDVLNMLFKEKVFVLDMAWNTITNVKMQQFETMLLLAPIDIVDQYMEARRHPNIIHYGTKPWNDPSADFAEEYWKIARESPFYEDIILRWEKDV